MVNFLNSDSSVGYHLADRPTIALTAAARRINWATIFVLDILRTVIQLVSV